MAIFNTRNCRANHSLFADLRFPKDQTVKTASASKARSASAPTKAAKHIHVVHRTSRALSFTDAPRRDVHAHLPLSDTPPSPAPAPPLSLALVSLSFAQRRKDIRWRKEGFEMASSDPDAVPFALRTHTLVPLDMAYARDDIRRRNEAFESRPLAVHANHLPPRTPSSTYSTVLSQSPSCPTIRHEQATLPSVYSQLSLDEDDTATAAEDTVTAVYEVYNGLTLYELGYGAASDEAVVSLTSIRLSSFDEESFIRMAENSLGW